MKEKERGQSDKSPAEHWCRTEDGRTEGWKDRRMAEKPEQRNPPQPHPDWLPVSASSVSLLPQIGHHSALFHCAFAVFSLDRLFVFIQKCERKLGTIFLSIKPVSLARRKVTPICKTMQTVLLPSGQRWAQQKAVRLRAVLVASEMDTEHMLERVRGKNSKPRPHPWLVGRIHRETEAD